MFQFRLLAASVTAAGLFAAMPAAAAIQTATYSGTVAFGFDQTGVFAAPGSSLAGYSWVASYTYNRFLGGFYGTDGFNYDVSYGGAGYGHPGLSPILSVSIKINGVTRFISGASAAQVYTSNSPFVSHNAEDYFDDGITQIYNYINHYNYPAGAPASLDLNFGPVAASGGSGNLQWGTYVFATGKYTEYAYADLGGAAVYSVGNAVPEPASWALLIAGFGLIGAAMRRRRGAAVAA